MGSETTPAVLGGLRVLELASMVAGPYCTKIMGDLGAEVIKIEPAHGDGARRVGPFAGGLPDPERSVLFLHLNTSKRSRILDLSTPEAARIFTHLAAGADVLVTDWSFDRLADSGVGTSELAAANPGLVVLCLTPFGAAGPYRDYGSEPLNTFHAAGEGYLTPVLSFLMPDVVDRPPVRQGRFAAEYKLATYAAGLVLAAVYHARSTGQGQTIDLSKQDALLGLNFLEFVPYLTAGEVPTRASLAVPVGGILPCADGYLQQTFHEEHQWRALLELLGNPDWSREEWATAPGSRLAHAVEINERLIDWLRSRTREEVVSSGQEIGATVAPYRTIDEVARSEQMNTRRFFQPVGHAVVGERLYPTGPWRFGDAAVRPRPAPLLGQDEDAAFSPVAPSRAPTASSPDGSGPLAGVRVVDLTWAVAGPTATMILASLGAEVIKVESSLRLDVLRHVEATGATTNRQKKAVTLNLRHPKAVELLKSLVTLSDVVADSFRPGVMEGLGLGYERLRAVKENLVVFSSSMAGQRGPQSRFAGYAPMFVALSGLGEMTGYSDGPPSQIRVGGDIIVGVHGAFALLAALLHLQRTGEGTYIDLSAIESESCLIGDSLLDYTMNGTVQSRSGNDEPGVAPHNCFRCRGDDQWVTIAVTTNDQWRAFVEALGHPAWAGDSRFSDGPSRFVNRDELDRLITDWTRHRSPQEVTDRLQDVGVAAMPSFSAPDLFSDPHVTNHGMVVKVPGPSGESLLVRLGGIFSATPMNINRSGPAMGEHNDEVFGGLLGLSQSDIDALASEGVFT
jgi:crotonobetainyl-CoA:carnitine CoA-transferase CaiB-like acyl-CoA transferase